MCILIFFYSFATGFLLRDVRLNIFSRKTAFWDCLCRIGYRKFFFLIFACIFFFFFRFYFFVSWGGFLHILLRFLGEIKPWNDAMMADFLFLFITFFEKLFEFICWRYREGISRDWGFPEDRLRLGNANSNKLGLHCLSLRFSKEDSWAIWHEKGGQDARKPHFPNQKRTRRV